MFALAAYGAQAVWEGPVQLGPCFVFLQYLTSPRFAKNSEGSGSAWRYLRGVALSEHFFSALTTLTNQREGQKAGFRFVFYLWLWHGGWHIWHRISRFVSSGVVTAQHKLPRVQLRGGRGGCVKQCPKLTNSSFSFWVTARTLEVVQVWGKGWHLAHWGLLGASLGSTVGLIGLTYDKHVSRNTRWFITEQTVLYSGPFGGFFL